MMLAALILLIAVVAMLSLGMVWGIHHVKQLHSTKLDRLDKFDAWLVEHRDSTRDKFERVDKKIAADLSAFHSTITNEAIMRETNLSRALHNGQLQLEQVKASIKLLAEEIGSIQNQLRRL